MSRKYPVRYKDDFEGAIFRTKPGVLMSSSVDPAKVLKYQRLINLIAKNYMAPYKLLFYDVGLDRSDIVSILTYHTHTFMSQYSPNVKAEDELNVLYSYLKQRMAHLVTLCHRKKSGIIESNSYGYADNEVETLDPDVAYPNPETILSAKETVDQLLLNKILNYQVLIEHHTALTFLQKREFLQGNGIGIESIRNMSKRVVFLHLEDTPHDSIPSSDALEKILQGMREITSKTFRDIKRGKTKKCHINTENDYDNELFQKAESLLMQAIASNNFDIISFGPLRAKARQLPALYQKIADGVNNE